MGFYREPVVAAAPRARDNRSVKIRVAADSLGATTWASQVLNKFGYTSTFQPVAPTPPPAPAIHSFALPLISTPAPAPAPAPITIRTFSPVAPPTPVPTSAPPSSPSSPSQAPDTTPQSSPSSSPSGSAPGGGSPLDTPSPSSPSPDQSQPTQQIRFATDTSPLTSTSLMPDATDASGPEVYNADGTPVTAAAKVASAPSIVDTLKNLPTAAKIGGAVVLYLVFARR